MKAAGKRKPKRKPQSTVEGITRTVTDRYIELTATPIEGMRVTARVITSRREPTQFAFDGTLPNSFLRQAELTAWMNEMRHLMNVAADERSSLKE